MDIEATHETVRLNRLKAPWGVPPVHDYLALPFDKGFICIYIYTYRMHFKNRNS